VVGPSSCQRSVPLARAVGTGWEGGDRSRGGVRQDIESGRRVRQEMCRAAGSGGRWAAGSGGRREVHQEAGGGGQACSVSGYGWRGQTCGVSGGGGQAGGAQDCGHLGSGCVLGCLRQGSGGRCFGMPVVEDRQEVHQLVGGGVRQGVHWAVGVWRDVHLDLRAGVWWEVLGDARGGS
jgi:hypothetical protein